MKKSLLLCTALCLTSTSAFADITNPFYIPERAFLTDSKIEIGRKNLDASVKAPHGKYLQDGKFVKMSEKVTYGITGTWAVYAGAGYDWMRKSHDGSFNIGDWTVGTKINTIDEAWRVQIGGEVTRFNYSKWRGVSNDNRKDTNLYLMAGTETGANVFFYTKFLYQDTDYADNRGYDNYALTAAVHLTSGKGATGDVGATFNFDNISHVRDRDLTFFGAGYLSIQNNIAVGFEADYVLASNNSIKTAYAPDNQGSYSLGVNLKYEF